MRKRLAKKIHDHPKRYSCGKYHRAIIRLGWRPFQWRVEVEMPIKFEVLLGVKV